MKPVHGPDPLRAAARQPGPGGLPAADARRRTVRELPGGGVAALPGSGAAADKIPQLSDLRQSGLIEQDAGVVLFLHRQEEASYSSQGARLNPYVVGVEVAKHRSGRTGKMKLLYTSSLTRFDNLGGL